MLGHVAETGCRGLSASAHALHSCDLKFKFCFLVEPTGTGGQGGMELCASRVRPGQVQLLEARVSLGYSSNLEHS